VLRNGFRPPLFMVGHVRSGTSVLHRLLLKVCPDSVDLTDDDYEARTFWQAFGLRIGSPRTGTPCDCALAREATEDQRQAIRAHLARRCHSGRLLINKNCHLGNKIGFVHAIFPEARFVHIIRDVMGTVASVKRQFEAMARGDEDHPPFINYWPDADLPCWHTVRDDVSPPSLRLDAMKRRARRGLQIIGLKKRPRPSSPSVVHAHARLSQFRVTHPDQSRYYPGAGFARLPEAWLTFNVNIARQLDSVAPEQHVLVAYSELVANTRETLTKILEFADADLSRLHEAPKQLDREREHGWRTILSDKEQETVLRAVESRSADLAHLVRIAGAEPVPESNTTCALS